MNHFSNLLTEKTDTILEQWIEVVRQDQQIESTDNLSYIDVRNHLPDVLKAMATVLSQDSENMADSCA